MSDMNLDPLSGLPPELAELDRELLELHVEERPSFAPELEAELEEAWIDPAPVAGEEPAPAGRRFALVAGLSLIILVTGAVPQARAALADLSLQALVSVGVVSGPPTVPVLPGASEVTVLATGEWEGESEASPAADSTSEGAAPMEPVEEIPPYPVLSVTFPELADRATDESTIRRHYPDDLQQQGIGGTTGLRLWVDDRGRVGQVEVGHGSGVAELDEAARRAARDLRFVPATRNGDPVGTWVEFEMVFDPRDPRTADLAPVGGVGAPLPPELAPIDSREWEDEAIVSPPLVAETRELLRSALGPANPSLARLGSVDRVLAAEPPAGGSPLRWRADAARALRDAIARDPDNPAPYLALGRILHRQSLHDEAGELFRRGIERAERGDRPASPQLVAELHYELGLVLGEGWRAWSHLGRVDPAGGELPSCVRERAGDLSADRLSVLAYLCPDELEELLEGGFVPATPETDLRGEMIAAFKAAVALHPSHPGANTNLLLELASEEEWYEVLNGARRFAWSSEGHPNALLLSGLALQRLGRSEEAMEELRRALWSVTPEIASALRDPGPLLSTDSLRDFQAMTEGERDTAREAFWASRDPIFSTEVNEREVEHMARAAEAILRFGSVDSDAGSVWVRYGAPRSIRSLGEGTDVRTEFWDYGSGPDLTFRRMATAEHLDLTREARAYLDDLRRIFPHGYGTGGRPVLPLPVQATRFGGPTGEVVVRSTVPGGLATGGTDSLEVGLFLLDSAGMPRDRFLKRIPARVAPVEVEAPLRPGIVGVALEIWHPDRAEAGTARTFFLPGSRNVRVSDLLLVEPVEGARPPVSRYDERVAPLASNRLAGDRVGVLFEVYDPTLGSSHVRITARAVPEGGGRAVPLGIESSWPRQLQAPGDGEDRMGGAHAVYATVDLSPLAEGPWELRVSVEAQGLHSRLEAVGPIRRLTPAGAPGGPGGWEW